jgi:hypothetical protein
MALNSLKETNPPGLVPQVFTCSEVSTRVIQMDIAVMRFRIQQTLLTMNLNPRTAKVGRWDMTSFTHYLLTLLLSAFDSNLYIFKRVEQIHSTGII